MRNGFDIVGMFVVKHPRLLTLGVHFYRFLRLNYGTKAVNGA